MDKTKRNKIILVTVVVIILILFLWWVLRTSDQGPALNENVNQEPPVLNPPSTNIEYQIPEAPKQNSTEFSVLNLAKTYAARFGSWSTDNQGSNIQELLPLSTSSMQNYLNSINLDFSVEEFMGVTTKSLSADILSLEEASASVLVSSQRIETNEDLQENIYYQEARVEMLKLDDNWLVDGFYWEE